MYSNQMQMQMQPLLYGNQSQPVLQDCSMLLKPPPSPLSHLSDNSQTNLLQYSQATPVCKKNTQVEEDEDMLQKINNILEVEDGEHMTRKQILLSYKVNQLQKLNRELLHVNHQLKSLPRKQVEKQVQSQQNNHKQHELRELQRQITKYKTQLERFQTTFTEKILKKDQEIQFWKAKVGEGERKALEELRERNAIITLLERKNKQLILALQSFESPPQEYPSQMPFNDHISSQMQSMINKLLKELTYQKKCNKKLSAEVKRLNAEVIMLEREGKERNEKMYHLEMKALRGRKERDQSPIRKDLSNKKGIREGQGQGLNQGLNWEHKQVNHNQNKYWQEEDRRYPRAAVILQAKSATKHRFKSPPEPYTHTPNRISPEKLTVFKNKSQPSSFTLMDMLNGDVRVRQQSKRAIASKLIQVYARKMGMGQYQNVVAQQVQVYNFIAGNPSSLKVRLSSLLPKSQAASPQSLLQNMAFILDALLNQVQSQGAGNVPEIDLNKWIEEIMRKQSNEEKERVMRRFAIQIKGNIQFIVSDMKRM